MARFSTQKPTFDASYAVSNRTDCSRYGCAEMPWHWASHWVLEHVNLRPDTVTVDLGAGNNPIVEAAFVKSGTKPVLVDLIAPTGLINPQWILTADMSQLPLAGESVDCVISISALEHLPPNKQGDTINEIWRILKPGGVAALTFGHLFHVNGEAKNLLRTLPFFVDRGCPVFPPLDIFDVVNGSGFEASDLPGPISDDLLAWPDLVVEEWGGYEQLLPYPSLCAISHCEIGVQLVK